MRTTVDGATVRRVGRRSAFESIMSAKAQEDKKLIVNCYSGQTAGQTTAILRLLGYDAVSINSGMGTGMTGGKGYISEGFPTVM